MTQFSILARVAAVGPMRVNELAELLVMDRTTLGRNIQPLERDGFVALEVGSDRRERLINLTPAGRRILTRAMVLWKGVHQRFESKFDTLEASALRETMTSIIKIGRELSSENAAQA
jgi:DNA-binding MarR family transcriptional regulator